MVTDSQLEYHKTCHVEGQMHITSIKAQSPLIGVMGKFGDGAPAQVSHPRHITKVQKSTRSFTNSLRVAL
ncbi:hypothetical protein TNCV_1408941 [Trichonephila clavipes]|uniref:Uncharacterized protein n=1 Tax=Trichonephila clavipes TaxID=2585209 RepID=A0A8X6R1N4_TRICX|nr:hypothetical protein TNCV_1408941 [Trichonephila clavipes]